VIGAPFRRVVAAASVRTALLEELGRMAPWW
jgi:hypothetical protein